MKEKELEIQDNALFIEKCVCKYIQTNLFFALVVF